MTDRSSSDKRRNGLIMVIVAGVLLVAAVGAGVFLLTADPDTDDPQSVARRFTDAYQQALNSSGRDAKVDDFTPVVCAADLDQLRTALSENENQAAGAAGFRLTVQDVRTDGDNGSFTVSTEISIPGADKQSATDTFDLVREGDGWRVCGLG